MTNSKQFKGNKASLPSKICVQCGREMSWRKSWAKNWDQVKYCSDACRRLIKQRTEQVGGTMSGIDS